MEAAALAGNKDAKKYANQRHFWQHVTVPYGTMKDLNENTAVAAA